jgi:hypothetical protein
MELGDYTKSIVAGIVSLGASLQVAQVQGGITSGEWATSVVGALIAGILTWSVSNTGTYAWLSNQEKLLTSFTKSNNPSSP